MNTPIILLKKDSEISISGPQIFTFLCCWIVGAFAGMNANLFSLMLPQVLPELLFSSDRALISQMGSYILFTFLVGWMCGGIAIGVFGDRFGRVKAMAISIALYTLSTGCIGFASLPWHLLVCRFVTGLGVGGAMLSLSILLSESWPARLRAFAIGAGITSYQAGVFLSGFAANFFSDWHAVFFWGASPGLLAVILPICLQESEIWKNSKQNEIKNSLSFLESFETHMKKVFQSENRYRILIGSIAFGGLLVGYWASLSWVPAWIQDLVGSTSTQEKNLATMYHAAAAMTGCLLAGYLANSWGRVPVILVSFIGAFAVSSWMFLTTETFTKLIYVQHGILGLFAGVAQAAMYIYLPELFTTQIRATAVGFCLNCGRIVTAILVLFVGVLVPLFDGYAYTLFAFSCIYLMGAGAVLFGSPKISQEARSNL